MAFTGDCGFKCAGSGPCIKLSWVCDKFDDCAGAEDEDGALCNEPTEPPTTTISPPGSDGDQLHDGPYLHNPFNQYNPMMGAPLGLHIGPPPGFIPPFAAGPFFNAPPPFNG